MANTSESSPWSPEVGIDVTATLVLVRHGEIVRPADTSNFDPAPLTGRGRDQIRALAEAWPTDPPTILYASPLLRAIQSATVLGERFGLPTIIHPCLREWAPDSSGVPQPEYVALEDRAWSDLEFVPPSGESLAMASRRARECIEALAAAHPGSIVAVAGHGTLFSLLTSDLKGERPTEEYKASIGFGHAAVVASGSALRLVKDFARYGDLPG